jgi:hypothetical protein
MIPLALALATSAAAQGPPPGPGPNPTRSAAGTITALSASSVTVTPGSGGDPLTCVRAERSPSLDGFSVGDRVGILCLQKEGQLYLVAIKAAPSAGGSVTGGTPGLMHEAHGKVVSVSATSITIGVLTCVVGNGSPSLAGYAVGDLAQMLCKQDGSELVLLKIRKALPPPGAGTTGPKGKAAVPSPKTARGPIVALSSTAITVGKLTCTIAPGSPSVTGYSVGDVVGIVCVPREGKLRLFRIGRKP